MYLKVSSISSFFSAISPPIAQAGSYATTISSAESNFMSLTAEVNSFFNTSLILIKSLSIFVSPIHITGVIIFLKIALTLRLISLLES